MPWYGSWNDGRVNKEKKPPAKSSRRPHKIENRDLKLRMFLEKNKKKEREREEREEANRRLGHKEHQNVKGAMAAEATTAFMEKEALRAEVEEREAALRAAQEKKKLEFQPNGGIYPDWDFRGTNIPKSKGGRKTKKHGNKKNKTKRRR
jgi:hypothetical protein